MVDICCVTSEIRAHVHLSFEISACQFSRVYFFEMGKGTRHQKFLKSEKAKVKLKAKKELLPKGTNITNTTFKVKKIVIREQLKTATNEPLSNYKLSLKELLSRLQHFNTTSRKDALIGLKQLITSNGEEILNVHVGQLISGVSPLALDKEKVVS